jgi:hypothetical protein
MGSGEKSLTGEMMDALRDTSDAAGLYKLNPVFTRSARKREWFQCLNP